MLCCSSFLTYRIVSITMPHRKNKFLPNISDTETISGIIMKNVFSVLLFLFSIVSIASAEVIDANIKGVDDGIKTSRQQDYREAVMNAKLQAIEQSGASIESITTVVNFQLKYDAVESKSSAILLPGFQIIDIGYVADGTYQIVLIGKIQVGGKATQARETARDGRFIAYDNGTVLDTSTNLMWAAKDNGEDVIWSIAKYYCESFKGAGYSDWRMPKLDELWGLYDRYKTYRSACGHDVHLTELIQLSCTLMWTAETKKESALLGPESPHISFLFGESGWYPHSHHYRVIPVRTAR
jgi:hypothetical protein